MVGTLQGGLSTKERRDKREKMSTITRKIVDKGTLKNLKIFWGSGRAARGGMPLAGVPRPSGLVLENGVQNPPVLAQEAVFSRAPARVV